MFFVQCLLIYQWPGWSDGYFSIAYTWWDSNMFVVLKFKLDRAITDSLMNWVWFWLESPTCLLQLWVQILVMKLRIFYKRKPSSRLTSIRLVDGSTLLIHAGLGSSTIIKTGQAPYDIFCVGYTDKWNVFPKRVLF